MTDADRFAELIEARPPASPAATDRRADRSDYHAGETGELVALVSALRELDFEIALNEMTRGRQRQRLVAMAAVRTIEATGSVHAGRHRAMHAEDGAAPVGALAALVARVRQAQSGRRVIAAVAGLSVVVAVLGVLALPAQNAIPGDTLYALKRGTEQARLALTGGEQNQGEVLLGYASTRLDELDHLLDEPVGLAATGSGTQAAGGEPVAELLVDTMETMDWQTTAGTSAMTTAAVDDAEVEILSFVGEWGIAQFQTLDDLSARMPEPARERAEASKELLEEIVQRLDGLAQTIDCDCLGEQARVDALGPLPCPNCADSSPTTSNSPGTPPSASGPADPGPAPLPPPEQTVPEPPPPAVPAEPGVPIPPVEPPIPPPPPPPPPPQVEGSQCLIGVEIGIIVGGICVPLPGIPPDPPPNEGEPCVLVDLPWPLDDILGIIVGGVCVIG